MISRWVYSEGYFRLAFSLLHVVNDSGFKRLALRTATLAHSPRATHRGNMFHRRYSRERYKCLTIFLEFVGGQKTICVCRGLFNVT